MSPLLRFRLIAGALVVGAIVLLVWLCLLGAQAEALGSALARLAADPWGLATLVDLALGLLLIATWMTVVEARPWRLLLWLPLLGLTGNIATMLFLLTRLRTADSLHVWLTRRM